MTRTEHANPAGFDAVDNHDVDYFVRFLDARTAVPGELRVKQLIKSRLRLRGGLAVLDVGSGTGTDACDLVPSVTPGGSVVGLDRSARMVEEARRRAAARGAAAEFIEGDATRLPFPDHTFDRVRAERILGVLDDPAALDRAVQEMVRVARPDGRLVLSEIDTGTMFLSSTANLTIDALSGAFTRALPNGRAGRHLPRLLVEAGLVDVVCEPHVVLNTVAFLRLVLAGQLGELVDGGAVRPEEAEAFWAEQEQGERDGWLCSGVTCFTVTARKPH